MGKSFFFFLPYTTLLNPRHSSSGNSDDMSGCRLSQHAVFVRAHLGNSFDCFWTCDTHIFQTQLGLHVLGDTCLYHCKKTTEWPSWNNHRTKRWWSSSNTCKSSVRHSANTLPPARQAQLTGSQHPEKVLTHGSTGSTLPRDQRGHGRGPTDTGAAECGLGGQTMS